MLSRIVRFVNLLLAALLAGNEFGTWAAVHRALWFMPTPEHIKAELALARRGETPAFRLTLAGTFCFVAMLVSTVRGNVPINNRRLELSPEETSPEEWRDLRERWDRLHALRVVLNVTGLGLLLLGTLREEDRR